MQTPEARTVIVTGDERLVVAHMLATVPWAGPEEVLVVFGSLHEAFETRSLPPVTARGEFLANESWDPQAMVEAKLTAPQCQLLLQNLPPALTPGVLGPAKVKLLGKLRALVK